MSIDNKEWLKSTNEFAVLGLKFLYLSNGGAIIAILANLHTLIDEEEYPAIFCALSLFIWGLIFTFISTLLGYLMYRELLISSQHGSRSKYEVIFGILAICAAGLSFFFFGFGAHYAVSILG